MKRYGMWMMAMVLALGMASVGLAQSAPPPAARGVAAAITDTAPPPIREESIYIPYSKLRDVFEKEGRGVFLPYGKFLELWQQGLDKTAKPAEVKPPVDSLITEVSGKASVSKDVVTIDATLKIEVLKEGWNEVPLRLTDVAITKATLDGEPARLIFVTGEGHKLLVEKKGKEPKSYTLAITFAKAYVKAPGQNSMSFESPAAPVSRWEVHIPESGVKVNVQPLLAATEVPGAKPAIGAPPVEETVVLAFVGAAPTVRLDWTPKAEGAKGLEALASVTVEQRTDIEEGVTRTRAALDYDISRAELGRLEIEVPADQKVVNVFDANVREWTVAAAGGVQKISIQLFEAAKSSQKLTVELERFSADIATNMQVPAVKALGVSRQQGFVVVKVGEGLRAEAEKRDGLAQVDEAELPGSLKSKWDFAYRYAAVPYALSLKVEKVQPRITAESLVEARLGTDKLSMNLLAIYTIERAGVFRLDADVPEGYQVRSVRGVTANTATPVEVDSHNLEGAKKTHLVVSLSRKAFGHVALEVVLEKDLREPDLLTPTGKAAAIPLVIPRVTPSSVERETGRLVIYAPDSLVVNPTKTDGLRNITLVEALNVVAAQRASSSTAFTGSTLSYAYTQEPVTVAISAERRKPYITAQQLLVARIDAGVVKYECTINYDIQYSGVKTLRLDIPKDLAGSEGGLEMKPDNFRHQPIENQAGLKDLAAGYVAWSISGETEFLGHVVVTMKWERPEKFDVGQKVTLQIPRLIPRDVDRAWGQIVLAKAETIDVQESAEEGKVKGLRGIDPQQDLMSGASVPNAARAFEFHEDWALLVDATMYKLEDVKRTSISRALVRMVVTQNDKTAVQALYQVRSARQRLLMRVPAGYHFDNEYLRLNGRPVIMESSGKENELFIPLVGIQPDKPFLLELRYTVPGGGLVLECPSFPEEQPAVQQVFLSVYLPEEWNYLGSRGTWTDEFVWVREDVGYQPRARYPDDERINWVREGCPSEAVVDQKFDTAGRHIGFSTLRPAAPPEGSIRLSAFSHTWFSVLSFGLVVGAGIVLMFTRARTRLLAIGAAIVAVILSGVFLPSFSHQVAGGLTMAAGMVVLVLWGLWYILVTRPRNPVVIARREAREARIRANRDAAFAMARESAARAAKWANKDKPVDVIPLAEEVSPPPPPPSAKPEKEGGESHA
jgi:hypothetical protein